MTIHASLALSSEKTEIILTDYNSRINIFYSPEILTYDKDSFYLLFKGNQFKAVHSDLNKEIRTKADVFIQVIPPKDLDNSHLIKRLSEITQKNSAQKNQRQQSTLDVYLTDLLLLLKKFGFSFTLKKKTPTKTQHRWNQTLSEIEFFVNDFGSQATVIWQKRNEMLIKKGARLRKEYQLNKDGSIGLGARMGTQLRDEQKDKIQDFVTTEDIVLKSVNEVGLFLYYGGTNSWLVLKDKNNKSIDEWSAVS